MAARRARETLTVGITAVILSVMKTAISIPDATFESAERLAKRLGISRSQLYSDAVGALIEKYRYTGVTEQLDAVYETNPDASSLEEGFEALQSRTFDGDGW